MNPNSRTRLFFILTVLLLTGTVSHAQLGVHTPKPGSPERKAIIEVLRLSYYLNNADQAHGNADGVFFNVHSLKVHGDWALACYDPVHADGKTFTEPYWWTLLHRKSGQWLAVDYVAAISDYESIHRAGPQTDDFDAIDMSALAIRKLLLAIPDLPKDIFPDRSKK